MKKQYINPSMDIVTIQPYVLQSGSPGGVNTGGKLGNEYKDGDVTYGRHYRSFDDEEDDEEY